MKEIVYISKKKGLYIMNVYDKVLEYAEESEYIIFFNKKNKRSYHRSKVQPCFEYRIGEKNINR